VWSRLFEPETTLSLHGGRYGKWKYNKYDEYGAGVGQGVREGEVREG